MAHISVETQSGGRNRCQNTSEMSAGLCHRVRAAILDFSTGRAVLRSNSGSLEVCLS